MSDNSSEFANIPSTVIVGCSSCMVEFVGSDSRINDRHFSANWDWNKTVCKDGEKDKTNLGMSFMVLGKTHGLRLTDGEKIATTVSAGLLTVGLGFATGGAAAVAAGAVVGVGVAGSMTAVAGASTIKGAVNIIEDESVGRTIDSLIPTGGAQKAKSESFQNLTSNQR